VGGGFGIGIQDVGVKTTGKRRRKLEDSHVIGCLCSFFGLVVVVGDEKREKGKSGSEAMSAF